MRLKLVVLVSLISAFSFLNAQSDGYIKQAIDNGLQGQVELFSKVEYQGDLVTVKVKYLSKDTSFHIYSTLTGKDMAYMPTSFSVPKISAGFVKLLGEPSESVKPHGYYDELMMGTINEHHVEKVIFTQQLKLSVSDSQPVSIDFQTQICHDGMCRMVTFPITLN